MNSKRSVLQETISTLRSKSTHTTNRSNYLNTTSSATATVPAGHAPTTIDLYEMTRLASTDGGEESEIKDAFELFAAQTGDSDSKEGVIAIKDVRRCLIALNIPPTDQAEMQEILETVDPENSGWVSYEPFVAIAALKLHAKHEDPDAMNEEVVAAYQLFTKGQEREINLNDLRRIARDLREDVPDNVLKDMIREATGGGMGAVGVEDFEGVMKRAGVMG